MLKGFIRVIRHLKKSDTCVKLVVYLIMHYDKFNPTAALKDGFAMEIHRKQKLQSKVHKGLKLENIGLMIIKKHPFIAASPDCLVTCKCCGDGLLKVKFPHNIRHQKPTMQNLDYLEFQSYIWII